MRWSGADRLAASGHRVDDKDGRPGDQPGNLDADRNRGEVQYPNELAEWSGRCPRRSRVRIRSAEWRRADHWYYLACPTIAGGRPSVTSEPSPAHSILTNEGFAFHRPRSNKKRLILR